MRIPTMRNAAPNASSQKSFFSSLSIRRYASEANARRWITPNTISASMCATESIAAVAVDRIAAKINSLAQRTPSLCENVLLIPEMSKNSVAKI